MLTIADFPMIGLRDSNLLRYRTHILRYGTHVLRYGTHVDVCWLANDWFEGLWSSLQPLQVHLSKQIHIKKNLKSFIKSLNAM